jgi:hypothetical protein
MREAALVLIGYVIGTANGAAILRYFGGALDKEWGCRGTDGARGEIVLPPSRASRRRQLNLPVASLVTLGSHRSFRRRR